MAKMPVLSAQLIKVLDERYKELCPDIRDSERSIWFKAGARSVVNMLIKWQEEDDLNVLS